MRILILGANGFVGRRILQQLAQCDNHSLTASSLRPDLCPGPGYEFIEADMCQAEALASLFERCRPEVVINAAALSVVDYCEQHPDEALRANTTAVEWLAQRCAESGCRLLHLSTDFVFDGHKGAPYTEDDLPCPVNHYGKTKWLAEQAIVRHTANHAILRVEVVYGRPLAGQHGNIALLVKQRLEQGQSMRVASDQWRTPTFVGDICQAVEALLSPTHCGTFHIAGGEQMSIAELALRTARHFGLDTSLLEPMATATMQEATPRPQATPLSIEKARQAFGYAPHTLEEGLRKLAEA